MATRAPVGNRRENTGTSAPPRGGAVMGLVSLAALIALTFGAPVALYVFGHDLIPTTVVNPKVMWEALSKPDNGHIFLQVLYVAAWIGWVLFFLSVFLEIVGQVQRRAALRLPGLGWLQRGVGTMVTAVVVLVGSPVAAMAATTPDGPPPSQTVATQTYGGEHAGSSARSGSQQEAPMTAGTTYTVRTGDSLWKIAQEQLGDPNRFADIAMLNNGRRMVDGSVFHYTEFLRAGWELVLPADAHPHDEVPHHGGSPAVHTPAHAGGQTVVTQASGTHASGTHSSGASRTHVQTAAPAAAPRTYTVRSGDSLSSIAKAQLGDARRWDEIFELNRGKPQPGGPPIWRADLIWPGDVLIMPGAGAPSQPGQPPTTADPAGQQGQQASTTHQAQGTTQQTGQLPAGAPPAQQAPDGSDHAAPDGGVTLEVPQDTHKTAGTVGGLLAAGVLTMLGGKRLARLRRRKPGERIGTGDPDRWELELRSVENPTGRVFIDAALRTLAARLAEVDRILPDITATVLKPHGLEIHLNRLEPPVAPFYADAARPGVWVCPLGAALADRESPVQTPYPALVSLGFDEGDDAVLVDLEATHGLSLLTPQNDSVAMLRAIAVELATGTWAEDLEVTLVGFGAELPSLFPETLRCQPSLAAAVEELAAWAGRVDDVLDQRDVSLREARTYPDAELAVVARTRLLLSATPLDAHSAYRLRQMMSGQQRTSVAVAAVVRDAEHALSPWVVTGPSFRTPPTAGGGPGLRIRMQALKDKQYAAIVRDLSGADLDDEWESAQRDGAFGGAFQGGFDGPDFDGPDFDGARSDRPGGPGSGSGSGFGEPGFGTVPRPGERPFVGGGHGIGNGARGDRGGHGTYSGQGAHAGPSTTNGDGARGNGARGDGLRSVRLEPVDPPRIAHIADPLFPSPPPDPDPAPLARAVPIPDPWSPERLQVDDLFRIDAMPPTADPAARPAVPEPGGATRARHALNPANLPQFDLVVTPYQSGHQIEQILSVPGAAPPPPPVPVIVPQLTMFAIPGPPPPSVEPGPRPEERLEGPELDDVLPEGGRRPGAWQTTYWSRHKEARSQTQNLEADPHAMSRSIDVLGPIELSGTAATAGSRAADLAEVAAYIMLYPGCTPTQMAQGLWPGRSGAVTIRDAQVARLREWLGTDAYGEEHLQTRQDGYRLGESVTCDWLEFSQRVENGQLVSALSLIRGRPFEDAPLRRYGWAEGMRHEMTAMIIDTAHFVAEACLREQNPRGAQNAAYRGLQAAPESELLYRDLLTALAALGDMASARQHADTLIAYADREGIDLQAETTALLRDVLQAVPGV